MIFRPWFILCLLPVLSAWSAEVSVAADGRIDRIGEVAIDVDLAGVLRYEAVDDSALDADQRAAITAYLAGKHPGHRFHLLGRRAIADCVLLVFNDSVVEGGVEVRVADGGIALVWSTSAKRVLGWYVDGHRG